MEITEEKIDKKGCLIFINENYVQKNKSILRRIFTRPPVNSEKEYYSSDIFFSETVGKYCVTFNGKIKPFKSFEKAKEAISRLIVKFELTFVDTPTINP